MTGMIISGIWLLVACALFGIGVVCVFTWPDKATAIALFGILAMMIGNWTKDNP